MPINALLPAVMPPLPGLSGAGLTAPVAPQTPSLQTPLQAPGVVSTPAVGTTGNGLTGVAAPGGAGAAGLSQSFADLLAQALQEVNTVQQSADAGAAQLAAGEPVDIHQVMIGMEKADLTLGLTLQVRNKLIDAYQEVMRMNI